ncbi:MAG: hypothetical protein AAFR61_16030 [Bacteroidota bacterium]
MMERGQLYKYATLGLLLLNLGLLGWIISRDRPFPPPVHERHGPRGNAQTIMGLSDAQHEAFGVLIDRHTKGIERVSDQQKPIIDAYFQPLLDAGVSLNPDSVLQEMMELEAEKLRLVYQHLQEVKDMLEPGQEDGFADFVAFIKKIIAKPPKKNPRRPKD